MKLVLATISPKRSAPRGPAGELVRTYLERSRRYVPCEQRDFATEAELLRYLDRSSGRTAAALLLTDSRGTDLTSDAFAEKLGHLQDRGTQMIVLAVGPADGWSEAARRRAGLVVSFGRMTLPHELAAVVAAEQIYRALTILAGHPYHAGH